MEGEREGERKMREREGGKEERKKKEKEGGMEAESGGTEGR